MQSRFASSSVNARLADGQTAQHAATQAAIPSVRTNNRLPCIITPALAHVAAAFQAVHPLGISDDGTCITFGLDAVRQPWITFAALRCVTIAEIL